MTMPDLSALALGASPPQHFDDSRQGDPRLVHLAAGGDFCKEAESGLALLMGPKESFAVNASNFLNTKIVLAGDNKSRQM
jgi:hypothetical protein